MTARRRAKRNPRTGLKTGHYIRKRGAERPASEGGPYIRKREAGTMYHAPTAARMVGLIGGGWGGDGGAG